MRPVLTTQDREADHFRSPAAGEPVVAIGCHFFGARRPAGSDPARLRRDAQRARDPSRDTPAAVIEYCNLTREQALEFREHVIAREPYYLRDLAQWMQTTGGPIDAMDASIASLDPLWQWYLHLAHREFEGLTDGLVPSRDPVLAAANGHHGWEPARQAAVVGDRLTHYLRLVLGRLVPGAYWDLYLQPPKGPVESAHQDTVVFLPGHTLRRRGKNFVFHVSLEPVPRVAIAAIDPTAMAWRRSPTRLREWILESCLPPELQAVPQEGEPSVLADYLDLELPPMPDIARTTPVIGWLQAPAPAPPSPVLETIRGDYTMAKGPSVGLDDEPWLLTPLPPDQVAAALTAGGFIDDEHGDRVDPAALLAGLQVVHADGIASIDPFVHDGAMRALFIEAVDATPAAWHRTLKPLYSLAEQLGARLAPDEDFD
jgi:hypothetical protein